MLYMNIQSWIDFFIYYFILIKKLVLLFIE